MTNGDGAWHYWGWTGCRRGWCWLRMPSMSVAGCCCARAYASATIICASSGNGASLRRSEEHTSELQSLMRISYAVFCLKKKKIHKPIILTQPVTTKQRVEIQQKQKRTQQ